MPFFRVSRSTFEVLLTIPARSEICEDVGFGVTEITCWERLALPPPKAHHGDADAATLEGQRLETGNGIQIKVRM